MNARDLKSGVYGGLAGGVVFGALMGMMGMLTMIGKMVGQPSAAVGAVVHLANSAIIGAGFAVLLGRFVTGVGSGLHDCHQAGIRNTVICTGAGSFGGAGGYTPGCVQHHYHHPRPRGWRRIDAESVGAQILLHRLHGRRQATDPAMCLHGQEGIDGTGWQRTVYCF